MSVPSLHLKFSLRTKLVLSYLAVTLGAILLLSIVFTLAVQNYFFTARQDQLRKDTQYFAQVVEHLYTSSQGNWNNAPLNTLQTTGPTLVVITDVKGNPLAQHGLAYLEPDSNEDATINQAIKQALQGQEADGTLQGGSNTDGETFSGLYVCVPMRYNDLPDGQIIGALFISTPENYPRGFSPYEFLANVNVTILIAGLVVSLIVILFSLFLARSLTAPVLSLTRAAEKMKAGDYAQRVVPPNSSDELEQLALSFNSMADTIQADVTELHRQEQMRRDLIANIAHDLITPLTAIQGFSEAIADDVISDSQGRHETAMLIGREVQRLRRLVGDMQNMTSLEAGRIPLDLAPLDMSALVDETVAVIQAECEQAGIRVENTIPASTPLVRADSDRIAQVLLNLLDNARRHTPSGGRLTIAATSAGKFLVVRVCDTGVGIAPQDLPHIFERFYKVDKARTGSRSGSGLGLAIVKAIITAHGGTIRAESTQGKGTCIIFTLPLNIERHYPTRSSSHAR